jgi:hypothetical protein
VSTIATGDARSAANGGLASQESSTTRTRITTKILDVKFKRGKLMVKGGGLTLHPLLESISLKNKSAVANNECLVKTPTLKSRMERTNTEEELAFRHESKNQTWAHDDIYYVYVLVQFIVNLVDYSSPFYQSKENIMPCAQIRKTKPDLSTRSPSYFQFKYKPGMYCTV